jgi:hypothetical protein
LYLNRYVFAAKYISRFICYAAHLSHPIFVVNLEMSKFLYRGWPATSLGPELTAEGLGRIEATPIAGAASCRDISDKWAISAFRIPTFAFFFPHSALVSHSFSGG